MISELQSIVAEMDPSLNETDVKLVSYLLQQGIEQKDIRHTGVSLHEFAQFLEKDGYTREEAEKSASESIGRHDVHFSKEGYKEHQLGGEKFLSAVYYPCLGIRLMGSEYLERHPEITDVKS